MEIAKRLRLAREAAGFRQSDAADRIGVARTTIVAIEAGQRRILSSELTKLARLYGTTANGLLRREAVHVDLAPRFRKLTRSSDGAVQEAVRLLCQVASAETELENLLGISRARNYPPERPILPGDVQAQAEQDAVELRQRLGLGNAPVSDLISLLELEFGVRIYILRLDPRVSGLYAYDEALGPCILLNASHPRSRRVQSAAHECGHFVSTRRSPEILRTDSEESSREERYAASFGRAFLMPARAVKHKFQEVTAGAHLLSRKHVIVLAHFFGVSREAAVRRLEELGLVKAGTWDWFQENGGITDQQERQVLGDLATARAGELEGDRATNLRLNLLAAEAHKQELLSEGQLSLLMCIDRVELRSILDSLEIDEDGTSAVRELPHRP
jgi:Zn-dependent peptidase ImmA (M78 family)/transcriptional regulator with XRE-family HTH domain